MDRFRSRSWGAGVTFPIAIWSRKSAGVMNGSGGTSGGSEVVQVQGRYQAPGLRGIDRDDGLVRTSMVLSILQSERRGRRIGGEHVRGRKT